MGKNDRMDYVVLEEEIEDNYQPTQEELTEYAKWLGMVLPRDKDLLWIAHEGLTKPLAKEWKPCRTEDDEIYYFNFETGESQWDHPCDEVHRNFLKAEQERLGRPIAKQQQTYCAIEPCSFSQNKSKDNTNDHQHKSKDEENARSELIALVPQPSKKDSADSIINEQMHDINGFQKVNVSEKLSKQEEVNATSTAWKSKKELDKVVGFSYRTKEEEDKEMTLQKEQMIEEANKRMEEEKNVILQQARQDLQERVNMIIKEEEIGLLADKRVKLLDVVDKQMELEKAFEIARRREDLKIELDEQIESKKAQMAKEKCLKMFDGVTKPIQEERPTEVLQRKMQSDIKFQRDAIEKDTKLEETRRLRNYSKMKEAHQNNCECLLQLNLELDEKQKEVEKKLDNMFFDSVGGRLQDLKDHMLHKDPCSLTSLDKRGFVCNVQEKLKLQELKLYDELKKKMVIRVREVISGLERHISEEKHHFATTTTTIELRKRVNELFEKLMLEVEIQLLHEKESLLREKREDMLGSFGALEIPISVSFDNDTTMKGWRCANDESNDVEIEYLWSNAENSCDIKVNKIEKEEDILSKRGSSCTMESSLNSNTSILPLIHPMYHLEEETNTRVKNIQRRSKSTTSRVEANRLETIDASIDMTSDLKNLKNQVEDSLKDLLEQFRKELKKDLLSYLPSVYQQESSIVIESDLPKDLPSPPLRWRSEVEKELIDRVQQYRDEFEHQFLTLKCEIKEELRVLLAFKEVILQNLRRTEQESQSKSVINENENENKYQHLVALHGYANPTTKQHQEVSNQHQAQVQPYGKWTKRVDDNNIFQLAEDTNSNFTVKDTLSYRETPSMNVKRLSELDMMKLQDAIAMFRQTRESHNINGNSMEQAIRSDYGQQQSYYDHKTPTIQDEGKTNSEHLKTQLLQPRSQPWTLRTASEIEEVEDRPSSFITLEFAMPREDKFVFHGMPINRYQCNSNGQHRQSNLDLEAPQTIWRI